MSLRWAWTDREARPLRQFLPPPDALWPRKLLHLFLPNVFILKITVLSHWVIMNIMQIYAKCLQECLTQSGTEQVPHIIISRGRQLQPWSTHILPWRVTAEVSRQGRTGMWRNQTKENAEATNTVTLLSLVKWGSCHGATDTYSRPYPAPNSGANV